MKRHKNNFVVFLHLPQNAGGDKGGILPLRSVKRFSWLFLRWKQIHARRGHCQAFFQWIADTLACLASFGPCQIQIVLFRFELDSLHRLVHTSSRSPRLSWVSPYGLQRAESRLAPRSVEGKVNGVAWDGTGYGTDGTIWGGEFLIADLNASPTCVTSHWLAETPPYASPGASRAAIFVMRWTPSPWPPCAARSPYRKHRFACLMQCLKNGSRPSTPPPVDASSTLTYNYSLTNL